MEGRRLYPALIRPLPPCAAGEAVRWLRRGGQNVSSFSLLPAGELLHLPDEPAGVEEKKETRSRPRPSSLRTASPAAQGGRGRLRKPPSPNSVMVNRFQVRQEPF